MTNAARLLALLTLIGCTSTTVEDSGVECDDTATTSDDSTTDDSTATDDSSTQDDTGSSDDSASADDSGDTGTEVLQASSDALTEVDCSTGIEPTCTVVCGVELGGDPECGETFMPCTQDRSWLALYFSTTSDLGGIATALADDTLFGQCIDPDGSEYDVVFTIRDLELRTDNESINTEDGWVHVYVPGL